MSGGPVDAVEHVMELKRRAEQAERERDAAIEWHVERNLTSWINAREGHVTNEDIERRERESRDRVRDIVQRRAAEDAS